MRAALPLCPGAISIHPRHLWDLGSGERPQGLILLSTENEQVSLSQALNTLSKLPG